MAYPDLTRRPDVLDHVAVDRHPLRILELDQVLDRPLRAARGGCPGLLGSAGVRERGHRARRFEVVALAAGGGAAIDAVSVRTCNPAPTDDDRLARGPLCGTDLGRRCRDRHDGIGVHQGDDLEVMRSGRKTPGRARCRRLRGSWGRQERTAPCERLGNRVPLQLDIRRHQVGDGRVGAAEENVLTRALEVVVDDPERASAVISGDGLGISVDRLDVRYVAVQDVGPDAVQGDAALHAAIGVAVRINPVDDQV